MPRTRTYGHWFKGVHDFADAVTHAANILKSSLPNAEPPPPHLIVEPPPVFQAPESKKRARGRPKKMPSQVCRSVSICSHLKCVGNAVSTGASGLPSAFISNATYSSTATKRGKVTVLSGTQAFSSNVVSFPYARSASYSSTFKQQQLHRTIIDQRFHHNCGNRHNRHEFCTGFGFGFHR